MPISEFYIQFSGRKGIVATDAEEALDCFYRDAAVQELQIEEAQVVDSVPVEDEP